MDLEGRPSKTSSRGGAFLMETQRKDTINDFLNEDPDYVTSQSLMESEGYMKPFSSDRKTVIADENGLNEIIIEGKEVNNTTIVKERYYGGFQIRKLRNIPQE